MTTQMTFQFQNTSPQKRGGGSSRDGIVLLVVLGMLTLFSVLGVSYLVFTGRQRNAAGALNDAEAGTIDGDPLLEDALRNLLVGANGPHSSIWGNDLLGDLYGQRDAIEGYVVPAANLIVPNSETQPSILLDGQMIRFGTLLHYDAPTNLATIPFSSVFLNRYPYGRNDIQIDRRYPGYTGGVYDLDDPTPTTTSGDSIPRFPMDDELNDRLLTFREGPLEGLTFPIIRYFGDHSGAPNGRDQLSGQTIIDIRGQLDATITLGEQSLTLQEWLDDPDFRVASLFYRMDNVFSGLNFNEEPYGFYVNGRMLNGPGFGWDRPRRSQSGGAHFQSVRGIDRQASVSASNPQAPFNLNDVVSTLISATRVENGSTVTAFSAGADDPNSGSDHPVTAQDYREARSSGPPMIGHSLSELGPDVPTALQANFAMHRLAPDRGAPSSTTLAEQIRVYLQDLPPGDADEPYDAPDFNNMFLSYFPGEELLGESAPSFVRPALINWILNNVTDTSTPTVGRLRQAFVALERSTMRPLPFIDTPTTPADPANRGSGVKRLNYANFTGGNESDGLSEPIDFNRNDVAYLQAKLLEVAQSLAGQDIDGDGIVDSWDVDNNGDGRVDSVWIDAGLPLTQTADGRLIKPLVSYMVEDLGGRVNVNLAGNILQARLASGTPAIRRTLEGAIQTNLGTPAITATPAASPQLVYTNAAIIPPQRSEAVQAGLPSGWGYGPAEIDISQIFQPQLATSNFTVNPSGSGLSSYTATNLIRGPQRIMAERAGMFSSIFGRQPPTSNMDDALYPYPISSASGQIFVAAGDLFDPLSTVSLPRISSTNPNIPDTELIPVTNATPIRNDFAGMLRKSGMPNLHLPGLTVALPHPQGLPVDAWGRGSVGLGVTGDLTVSGVSHITTSGGPFQGTAPNRLGAGDTLKDPYEFAMNAVQDPDQPFTYSDLEPLLNGAGLDRDLLSQRLIEIIEDYHNTEDINGNGSLERALGEGPDLLEQLRQALADSMTTHSNSVATVRGGLPSEFSSNTSVATSAGGPQEHIKRTMALANPAATNQEINAVLWELMPPDLRAGRKFNLNRPFGNGFDDDGDGVIDDDQNGVFIGNTNINVVADAYFDIHHLGENRTATIVSTTRGNSSPGELNNNFAISAANPIRMGVSPRAQFARHLYVMTMMLIRDANTGDAFDFPHRYQNAMGFNSVFYDSGRFTSNNETSSAAQLEEFNAEYRAWKVAQWAANVADFRDADSVMTRFDYDPNPFDGWDVALEDERTYRTVWGLERPELTLEESFAFHNRNVRDTNADVSGQKSLEGSDGNATRGEDDMDQYRIPQGSLFLELRNTRSPQALRLPGTEVDPVANPPSYPNELYRSSTAGPGLNLGALAPPRLASSGNPAVPPMPVWRIAISEAHCPDAELAGANGDRRSAMVDAGTGSRTVPFYEGSPDLLFQPAGSLAPAEAAAVTSGAVVQDRDTATLDPTEPQFFENVGGEITSDPIKTAQRDRAIERVIVFTPGLTSGRVAEMATALPELEDAGQIFYNRFNSNEYVYNSGSNINELLVPPGQHVVIGPRPTTHIGARKRSAGADVANPDTGAPQVDYADFESPQRFELTPHQLSYYQTDGTDRTPTAGRLVGPNTTFPNNPPAIVDASIRPVVGIQAAADAPEAWATLTTPIGVNVSEPIPYQNAATKPAGRDYYPEPTSALDSARGYPVDAYRDYDGGGTGTLPDTPFDSRPGMSELHRVLGDDGVRTGTRMFFKTAYLQRLADPTQPYHPEFNPYLSVDYITIDLTVFNGSDDNNESKMDTNGVVLWPDMEDEDPFGNGIEERFNTRYKTGKMVHEAATSARFDNLTHSINTFPPETNPAPGVPLGDTVNFNFGLTYDTGLDGDPNNIGGAASRAQYSPSLGYANHSYGPRWRQGPNAPTGGGFNEAQRSVSPFVGLPHIDTTSGGSSFYRDLMWLNRPYVSAHELMWVPVSGPGRIGLEFGVSVDPTFDDGSGTSTQAASDQYDGTINTITAPAAPPTTVTALDMAGNAPTSTQTDLYSFNERFKHLWNYFSSSSVFEYTPEISITEPYPDVPARQPAPNFYRLLEWVGVPAPYDFESDFISPLTNVGTTGDHLFGLPLDYKTFGNLLYPPVTGAVNPLASVNGDPRSWTTARPNGNIGFVPDEGVWRDTSPSPGAWNGFWTNYVATEPFRPPFNIRDSLFRSGLVNLNTVKNIRSYKAVVSPYSTPAELDPTIPVGGRYPNGRGAFFNDFIESRLGYSPDNGGPTAANNFFEEGVFPLQAFDSDGDGTADTPSFDRNIPTQFAGVFKSAMGANIAPLESMRERPTDASQTPWDYPERDSGGTDNPRLANSETQSSQLRQDFDQVSTPANDKPVFARIPTDPAVSTAGAHGPSVVNQQLGLTRMSNLATDQSNVFAVWVTVGLFEVDSRTLTVGQEFGADLGTAQRQRGFYIIDRSKPVMYEPGEWNNARETVVYERVR